MGAKPVIVVFGYSKDRTLFEQALRTHLRLVAKGEACAVRLYDDANDPMYPDGAGMPQGVTRVETSWSRQSFVSGARSYNEETIRGALSAFADALEATGADWVVKTDCDAAVNSLAFLDGVDPSAVSMYGTEGAVGFSMGVLYAISAPGLAKMTALMSDVKTLARLVVLDKPEAQSMSLLASLVTDMRRMFIPKVGQVGPGWTHSMSCFVDGLLRREDILMRCFSVYFKPATPAAMPMDKAEALYVAALARMTTYVDHLLEYGDSMAPKPPPRTFSKLRLYAALSSIGKWDALEAWLKTQTYQGMNAWTAFSLAQDLSEGNAMFMEWLASIKEALGLDDETAETILAASVAE